VAEPASTLEGVRDHQRGWVSRLASRAFVVLLFLICVAGGTGLLGGRTSTATAEGVGKGYRMVLSYPHTARPGLDAFWELEVVHAGGFHGPITLAVTGSYFDLFETQGYYPTPSSTTRDGTYVYMTFTPPPGGDTFKVMFDSYVQPYVEPSHLLAQPATVILLKHGQRVDAIHFSTWLFP
jgi:hypothetical protein